MAAITAKELCGIARKLTTYASIYTGDKEALEMAARCLQAAEALDMKKARRAPICEECGVYRSDPPSPRCVGCDAYRDHQR